MAFFATGEAFVMVEQARSAAESTSPSSSASAASMHPVERVFLQTGKSQLGVEGGSVVQVGGLLFSFLQFLLPVLSMFEDFYESVLGPPANEGGAHLCVDGFSEAFSECLFHDVLEGRFQSFPVCGSILACMANTDVEQAMIVF